MFFILAIELIAYIICYLLKIATCYQLKLWNCLPKTATCILPKDINLLSDDNGILMYLSTENKTYNLSTEDINLLSAKAQNILYYLPKIATCILPKYINSLSNDNGILVYVIHWKVQLVICYLLKIATCCQLKL